MSNQEGPEFVTPGALSLSPALPPSLVKVIEEAREQIAHRALSYRDAGETGERYAALLRQAAGFVPILRRLELSPPPCWYAHPQLVSIISTVAERWDSTTDSGISFWSALFDLTRQSELWNRANTHKPAQHPTDDQARTARLFTFQEVIAAAERGETAMWAADDEGVGGVATAPDELVSNES